MGQKLSSIPSPVSEPMRQSVIGQPNDGRILPVMAPANFATRSFDTPTPIAPSQQILRREEDRSQNSTSSNTVNYFTNVYGLRLRRIESDTLPYGEMMENARSSPGRSHLLNYALRQAMLSDHSSDEREERPRGTVLRQERAERRPYVTIPAPSVEKPYESYRNLRHKIQIDAGVMYDEPSMSIQVPDTITQIYVPLPSCSTASNVMRNCRYGLARQPQFRQNVGIDAANIVALRNRATPNKRKVVDRTATKIFCIDYLNEGKSVLTASQDSKLRIYDQTGPRRRYVKSKDISVPYIGWSILDVTVSPDGHHATYSTWSNVLYECDLREEMPTWRNLTFEPDEARFGVFSIKYNSTCTEIATGATSGLYVYDRETERCTVKIDAHDDDVNAVCYPDDHSLTILSSGDDGLIKLWDRRVSHWKPMSVYSGHRDGVTYIDSKLDGYYFLSNSKDQSIKVWDLRVASDQTGIQSTRKAVSSQRWDYRWQMTQTFKTNNLPGDSSVMTLRGHSVLHTLVRAKFSPASSTGNRFIYTGCARGGCLVYDLYTGKMHKRYGCHRSVVRDVAWHPYDNELVTSAWDGNVHVWRYDPRGPVEPELDSESQVVQDYDSTDEFDQPLPQKQRKQMKRSLPPVVQYQHLDIMGFQTERTANRVQIKTAREEEDSSSEEERRDDTYAAVARRNRRQRY